MTTQQKQHNNITKLLEIESELTDMLSQTNPELMAKFDEWHHQKEVCNEGFFNYLKELYP